MLFSIGASDVVRSGRCAFLVLFGLVFHWSATRCVALGNGGNVRGGLVAQHNSSADASVYYVTEMTDRFMSFMSKHKKEVDMYHAAEQSQIQTDIKDAVNSNEKSLLEIIATMNEETRLETANAFNGMMTFATTLKHAMGARDNVVSCQFLQCGEHASCSLSASGFAECQCEDGYEGNGFVCNPPMTFIEHPLINVPSGTPPPHVADLHVSTLHGGQIAVVFRDISKGNQGRLMLGNAKATRMEWNSPIAFSGESPAYGPVLVELQDSPGHIAIAFRDKNRGGLGILVGGAYNLQQNNVAFTAPMHFARYQAQRMAMLPLPDSRVVIIFSEHTPMGAGHQAAGMAMYGSAVLAKIHTDGTPLEYIGKTRFVKGPVARISAAMLSPVSFVMAYRHAQEEPTAELNEASCMFGQLVGPELMFNTHSLSLEPEQTNIWARSVAPIRDNMFAYTYHSGNEVVTKQAILQVDPKTLQVNVLQNPTIISRGFTPYIGTVSTSTLFEGQQTTEQLQLLSIEGPRTVTYFSSGDGNKPHMQICAFNAYNTPASCKSLQWSRHEMGSVTGAPVGDGRFVFVFTDITGAPYYQFVGVMDPSL